jgi:hypothetical protein
MTSPTFVAKFADSEVTRMTTYTSLARLDVARGVRLAKAAYQSRTRSPPPPIIEARFETVDGTVLKSYSTEELAG